MKVRNIKNLPVLLEGSAELLGLVEKVVIGDDYKLAYLVINSYQSGPGIIFRDDFMLGEDSVLLWDMKSIKSYAHGEESSIYEKKLGVANVVYILRSMENHSGKFFVLRSM